MAGSNCSSRQEAWGEIQQCTRGEATKWAGWLGPEPPPRDSDAEFNLVLSNTGRVYLYIFEICGELMQVVRDKIRDIWAVAVTLKYCSQQSQLCHPAPAPPNISTSDISILIAFRLHPDIQASDVSILIASTPTKGSLIQALLCNRCAQTDKSSIEIPN